MTEIVEKLATLSKDLVAEKGEFFLFALFERKSSIGLYDVIVSAEWLNESNWDDLTWLTRRIQGALNVSEIIHISKVLIVDPRGALIRTFMEILPQRAGILELKNVVFGQHLIRRAFVLRRESPPPSRVKARRAGH